MMYWAHFEKRVMALAEDNSTSVYLSIVIND